jgi:Cd2+/Zn2+-exporting ATPase
MSSASLPTFAQQAPTAKGQGSAPAPSLLERVFSPDGELRGAIVAGVLLTLGWGANALIALGWVGSVGPTIDPLARGMVWASLAIGMVFGGRAALDAIRARKVDIDVLMVVGAALAALIGAPAEGALLLFLFTLSGALEDLAMRRTTRAVEALHKLMPTAALRREGGPGGTWISVVPEDLVAGDVVQIRPGELVPTDARVSAGTSSINQASITGESMPREVRPGDDLFAGTINAGNPIEAVVTRPSAQSSLQKILNLVIEAQQQREPVQRLIDRLNQPYAIGVFAASLAVMLIWRYALGVPWLGEEVAGAGGAREGAVFTAITLLIVASPCALIISTPTATLAAISRAARGGVLFKGGQSIERLARLRAIAFDKTGTLTIGRPRVMQVREVGWPDARNLLAVAAALESNSTHPIAQAVLELARERGVEPAEAGEVKAVQGRGIEATINGEVARIGSLKHVQDLLSPERRVEVEAILKVVQHRGHIAIVCASAGQAGVFMMSDAARPGAECLVERLHDLGVRPVVMLTGDNAATAARVAESLVLDEFHAELLPQDKVDHVARLKAMHGKSAGRRGSGGVGVIGDGVNDAPALAAADVSIAIGSIGSDAALESADIVLLSDDLSAVPWAVHLARRARRTITINLIFSIAAILVMGVAVLAGHWTGFQMPLWLGVVGHEGGTLLVVGHSLWLLAFPAVPICACDRTAHLRASRHTPLTVEQAAA